MVICAIVNCHNRSDRDKNVRFFRLPAVISHQGARTLQLSTERQRKWIAKINRKDLTTERYASIRICSRHFVSGSPTRLVDEANPDWIPTLHLGYCTGEQSEVVSSTLRYDRAKERLARKRKHCEQATRDSDTEATRGADTETTRDADTEAATREGDSEQSEDQEQSKEEVPGTETQTIVSSQDLDKMDDEVKRLRAENTQLIEVSNHIKAQYDAQLLTEHSFGSSDNEKVLYYTGLGSMELFSTLLTYVNPYLKERSSLTKFQQLLLSLMRLRLNLSGQDLGYRFHVHQSTISRVFEFVIGVLYCKLKPLIRWPDRDALRKTMPMVFRKHYPNCVVIIDCFEVFIDRPTDLLARAQTYSQYKHHNTVKYLIGITPQGSVRYISSGWGGRTSDKYITENSSFLSYLVPGDLILADRGFDIRDSVSTCCSSLVMPAFTKGKSQLSGIEVEQTQRIANVRIHVKRVIGNIKKKFSILSDTQPIDFLVSPDGSYTLLDKIVYVCCALHNICDSVISFD